MKNHSIKFITAIALAVVFTLSAMYSTVYAVTRSDVPQSFSLENIFNVEYGTEPEKVTTGASEAGDGIWQEPELYAVTDNDDVYVADTYNQMQHMPIKHYDCKGRYIDTLPCEEFTSGDLWGMIAVDGMLYVYTSEHTLCCYSIETGEITKHNAENPEGYNYYGMETVANRVALVYEKNEDYYYDISFLTFDTEAQSFVPSDDVISVTARKEDDHFVCDIKFEDISFTQSLYTVDCYIPMGISKNGNLYITKMDYDGISYCEYSREGKCVGCGVYDRFGELREYVHVIRNEITVNSVNYDYTTDSLEYILFKVGVHTDTLSYVPYLYMPMAAIYSIAEDKTVPEDMLTYYLFIDMPSNTDGPHNFAVTDDGEIWVVDTWRTESPVKHYSKDGKYAETLDPLMFSDYTGDGVNMLISRGTDLYVYTAYGFFSKYDTLTKEVTHYGLVNIEPEYMPISNGWKNVGKYIIIDSTGTNQIVFAFDTEKGQVSSDRYVLVKKYDKEKHIFTFRFSGTEYKIPLADEKYAVDYFGTDADGNIYVKYYGEEGLSFRKYSKDGKLLGYMKEWNDSAEYNIGASFERMSNGEIIRARTTREVYSLDRVVFNEDYFKNAYDINFDGAENTADAVAILKYSAEMITFDSAQAVKADINGDCKTNTADAVAVLKFCAGM